MVQVIFLKFRRLFWIGLLLFAGLLTSGQHKSLRLEYLVISVYEPAQSDVLQSAAMLLPKPTEIDRKLQDMRNMGLIIEVSVSRDLQKEVTALRDPGIRSAAEVLEKASEMGWKLISAFYQEVNGFPMKVFVFHRKKKKK